VKVVLHASFPICYYGTHFCPFHTWFARSRLVLGPKLKHACVARDDSFASLISTVKVDMSVGSFITVPKTGFGFPAMLFNFIVRHKLI